MKIGDEVFVHGFVDEIRVDQVIIKNRGGYFGTLPDEAIVGSIVRCKDCKHKVITEDGEYNPEDIVCDYWMSDGLTEKDFCSYGERSEE